MKKKIIRLIKNNNKNLSLFLVFFLCFSFIFSTKVFANLDVRLIVEGCNNNTICEAPSGEDINTCPNDCTPVVPPPFTPAPTGSSGSQNGGSTKPIWEYTDVSVVYQDDYAVLSWNTTRPTQSIISWGNTDDYANGSVSEIGYVREHITKIANIVSGKKYYFKINARDAFDTTHEYTGSFFFKKTISHVLTPNVSAFNSYTTTTGIGLRWINPDDELYSYVRILRSNKDYPLNPNDGKIVYEGRGQTFVDIDVFDDTPYYYTIFVKGVDGTYSSGVLLIANKYKNGITPLDSDKGFPYGKNLINTSSSSLLYTLLPKDIDFIQEDKKISFVGDNVAVDASLPLIIGISKNDLPQAFLVLTPTDQESFSTQVYLLAFNPQNGRLEVNIPALNTVQPIVYSLQILHNGYFHQLYKGVLNMYMSGNENETQILQQKRQESYFILQIILIMFILILLFSKKKKKKRKSE